MKLENCPNNSMIIVGRTAVDSEWHVNIAELVQPATVFFQMSACSTLPSTIKKICWEFGDNTKIISLTNRKQQPELSIVKHVFKSANMETLTIQASVFTPPSMFIATMNIGPFTASVKKNYIDPEFFKNQIVEYYESDDLKDDLALSVQQIANRLAFAPNFINYTYREDMVGDALIKMIKALREQKFDPKRGNPFSYFTKIAFHAFCNRIKKEKKNRDTLTSYQNNTYDTLTEVGYLTPQNHTNVEDISTSYENF